MQSGEYDAARTLFSEEPLDIWFGFPTDRLALLLNTVVEADPYRVDAAYGIHVLLRSANEGRFLDVPILRAVEEQGGVYGTAFQYLRMFGLRIAGRPVEALEGLTPLASPTEQLQPFVQSNNSWPLFESLQLAFTAMLAGDNQQALTRLAEAKHRRQVQRLSFLSKDAWAKSALLQAAWGDPIMARADLSRAEPFAPVGSWAEDAIEVHLVLTEVLLNPDPQGAFETLKSVDLHNIGEVWPFYVYTVFHTYQRLGAGSEVEHELLRLQSLPFPRETGQGFTGSVFPMTLAIHELFAGHGQAAKRLVRQADRSIVVVQLVEALIETYTGNPRRALQLTSLARKHTMGLRQLDLARLAVEATAHHTLSDDAAVLATMKQALQVPRSLTSREVLVFPQHIRAIAETHLEGWPTAQSTPGLLDLIPEPTMQFTNRELEVLRYLREDLTRAEIAEQLFLSVNTVKTQLNSLYRKLGVSSREEALLAANHLGLE